MSILNKLMDTMRLTENDDDYFDESELVTIYYGEDVTEEDAEAFCEKARKEFTSCEFECQNGGQPIYYYMISVE